MLEWATQVCLRFVASAILVSVAVFCVSEVVRLWSRGPWVLTPFTYFSDQSESKADGVTFAQQVHVVLRTQLDRIQNSRQRVRGQSEAINIGPALPDLLPVELPREALTDVTLNVQGLDVSGLLRSVSKWINPPREISGVVSADEKSTSAQVIIRDYSPGARSSFVLRTEGHSSRESAVKSASAGILFHFLTNRGLPTTSPDRVFGGTTEAAFFKFLDRLEEYFTLISMSHDGRIQQEEYATRQKELEKSIREASDEFPEALPLRRLLIFSQTECQKYVDAIANIDEYLKSVPDDNELKKLKAELIGTTPIIASSTNAPVKTHVTPALPAGRTRLRPMRPGISVGNEQFSGTICCFAKDTDGHIGFLTPKVVVGGTNAKVYQPGGLDSVDYQNNTVGHVARTANVSGIEVAFVQLADGITWQAGDAELKMNGTSGLGTSPALGQQCRVFGRTVGEVRGVVNAIDAQVSIGDINAFARGLFVIKGEVGTAIGRPGDTGAPVLNARSELIGMLVATNDSGTEAFCLPINDVAFKLGVEILTSGLSESPKQ